MKILTYVPKIYEPAHKDYQNDKSGLALYVHDIVQSLSVSEKVFVITQQISSGGTYNNIHYLKNTKKDIICHTDLVSCRKAINSAIFMNGTIKDRLKRMALSLEVKRFETAITEIKPDIVNIHGCNPEIFRQINICKKKKIPFVISLHGLIGLDASVNASDELKKIEGDILRHADREQWPIVAISSGVKNRAVDYYSLKKPSNIEVILNGTYFTQGYEHHSPEFENWFASINPQKRKVILCVGAISKRKNQTFLVSAWNQMPEEFRNDYIVLFLGKDLLNNELQQEIAKNNLQDSMIVCGHVEKEVLSQLYRKAKLNVLVSIDEGFGLSIIESMSYGVPTVTFDDLDAVNDLYNEKAMVVVHERTVVCFAQEMITALKKDWNCDYISEYSNSFSMDSVRKQYLSLYRRILDRWT